MPLFCKSEHHRGMSHQPWLGDIYLDGLQKIYSFFVSINFRVDEDFLLIPNLSSFFYLIAANEKERHH